MVGALVLVVEDDATLAEALEVSLANDGYNVIVEHSGERVSPIVSTRRPALVVLDVRLPGADGFEIARKIRRVGEVPIIFLTAADAHSEILEGFAAGGDDYVTKPFAMSELLARVRAVLRRVGQDREPPQVEVGDLIVDRQRHAVSRGGSRIRLTPTEFDLLWALASRAGSVVPKHRLLEEVWGRGCHPNVLMPHMSSLRSKLEADGVPLIETVRGVGYLLRD